MPRRGRRSGRVALALGVLALCAPDAGAQTGDLFAPFGGTRGAAGPQDVLTLSVALAGARHDDITVGGGVESAAERVHEGDDLGVEEGVEEGVDQIADMQRPEMHSTLSAQLLYAKKRRASTLDAQISSSGRYDHARGELLNLDYGAVGRYGRTLGRNTSFSVSQSAGYSTASMYQLLPPAAAGSDPSTSLGQSGTSYSTTAQHLFTSETSASISRSLTRRGSVSLTASAGYAGGPAGAEHQLARSHSATAGYYQTLTRDAKLRLEYRHRAGQYGAAPGSDGPREAVLRDVALGVDYDRALSRSRRTFVSFGSGSSMVDGGQVGVEPTRFQVVGHAGLRHQIGRTWQAQVRYERGVHLMAGFEDPVASDGVGASLGGKLTSRVGVMATATGATGWVGASMEDDHKFLTYSGAASVRFELNRAWALYGSYVYYFYDVGHHIALRPGAQRTLERRGVQFGVVAWAPILRR